MRFRYKQYRPDIIRPVIPIELQVRNRSIKYEVLIDSGADICLFDREIGELLGLDVASGESRDVAGIAGQATSFYIHPVEITVADHQFETVVGFLKSGPNRTGYGVVGQHGFFDQFHIAFNWRWATVELQPNSR